MPRSAKLMIVCLVVSAAMASAAAQQPEAGNQHSVPTMPFDSYGWLNGEDASARLDNFAIELQNNPESVGYVITYGPEGEGGGTGQFALEATVNYLVAVRGIDPARLKTVFGGRYYQPTELRTDLWVLPLNADLPPPKVFENKGMTFGGKLAEFNGWDGYADGDGGPSFGDVRLAGFGDTLQQQPNAVGYIVSYSFRGAVPGLWRRVAKRDASDLEERGISSDRVKVLFGGTLSPAKDDDAQLAKVQYWVLPSGAPPPVKEQKSEPAPSEAVQIGTYQQFSLGDPKERDRILDGFAEVLKANARLNVCIILRPPPPKDIPVVAPEDRPDLSSLDISEEPPDIDLTELAEAWKLELKQKYGIETYRVIVLTARITDESDNSVDVWVMPAGAVLPDTEPPVSPDEENEVD